MQTQSLSDARNYVSKIKNRFKGQETFRNFLDILHETQRCKDYKIVYEKIKELFKDHQDLIEEFIQFLPDNFNVQSSEEPLLQTILPSVGYNDVSNEPLPPNNIFPKNNGINGLEQDLAKIDLNDINNNIHTIIKQPAQPGIQSREPLFNAMNYVSKIRNRFNGQETYKNFLSIVRESHSNPNHKLLYDKIKELFKDHQDLIEEFAKFLPDNNPIENSISLPSDDKNSSNEPYIITKDHHIKSNSDYINQIHQNSISFSKKLQKRFKKNSVIYKEIIVIITKYSKIEDLTSDIISMLYNEISPLFGDNNDLTLEFAQFLPDTISQNQKLQLLLTKL